MNEEKLELGLQELVGIQSLETPELNITYETAFLGLADKLSGYLMMSFSLILGWLLYYYDIATIYKILGGAADPARFSLAADSSVFDVILNVMFNFNHSGVVWPPPSYSVLSFLILAGTFFCGAFLCTGFSSSRAIAKLVAAFWLVYFSQDLLGIVVNFIKGGRLDGSVFLSLVTSLGLILISIFMIRNLYLLRKLGTIRKLFYFSVLLFILNIGIMAWDFLLQISLNLQAPNSPVLLIRKLEALPIAIVMLMSLSLFRQILPVMKEIRKKTE